MSAIGREGGHSRGRSRQQPSQENISSGAVIDNERASFGLERANDRGGADASGSNQRNEQTGERNRNENNLSYPNR
jgi:hypothetical protein